MVGDFEPNGQLLKGVLPMLILELLREEESYGYQLVTRLAAAGLREISTGSVYPVLTRLEREGALSSHLVASDSGPARKYYRLTPDGESGLRLARERWLSLTRIVALVLEEDL